MTDTSTGHDRLGEDLQLLEAAVREAGAVAYSFFGKEVATKRKSDGTPVSEADIAADTLLRERLMGARPNYGWLSEETTDDLVRLSRHSVWVVDPIDGTYAFLDNKPEWTVIAALVEDGLPVLSVIFNPVTDEMFTARRGAGAFLNGVRVTVKDVTSIEGSRLFAPKALLQKKIWNEPWPDVHYLSVHSIAYRVALIAAGRAHGALSVTGKSEWDLAAPTLLLEEAGGRATGIDGTSFTFNKEITRLNGFVAAGPVLHELLIARTKSLAA
jgi:myo-inositol-1(or 4)-monophosphatase